jgi:hypothetical protein
MNAGLTYATTRADRSAQSFINLDELGLPATLQLLEQIAVRQAS